MKFLDRIEEVRRLKAFLSYEEGGLACLYGRRRVGKSRLLTEILKGRTDVVYHEADREDAVLQRERLARDVATVLEGFADVVYTDWGRLLDRWQKDAPRGSVLVLDEFPYLVEQTSSLPSIVQRIVDKLRESGQKIIISESSQRMMQGLVLSPNEPLYGRAMEMLNIRPLDFRWLKVAFPKLSPMACLEYYGVWGGVPRYWEIVERAGGLKEALRDQVFSSLGLLRTEPTYLLQDDLSDSVQATAVLSLIGQGCERPSEIASRLQVPQTALSRPLKRLMELGLVRKDTPFGADEKGNKKSLYKVADPFLAFWYRFVQPRYSNAHYLETASDAKRFKEDYRTYLGGVWEEFLRERLGASRWWGAGLDHKPMEIDIVAESEDKKTLLVGEAKLSLADAESARELEELKKKALLLPFASNYANVECKLFVADSSTSGVETFWG